MNFLEWLGFNKVMEDTEPKNVVKLPTNYVKPVEPLKPREYYRVGRTEDGQTTLTMLMDHGYSTTLTMNRAACEQLIRMLRATYDEEEVDNG